LCKAGVDRVTKESGAIVRWDDHRDGRRYRCAHDLIRREEPTNLEPTSRLRSLELGRARQQCTFPAMATAARSSDSFRAWTINVLFRGLRLYTRHAPFKRGRGFFIRAIELLKRRGWPPPLSTIGDGLTMEFEPSLLGWTIFERGSWEPKQTALVLEYLHPGAVVLDVGANTGYYVLLAASAVGANGHVHAFEIQQRMVEILHRNVVRNGLQQVVSVVGAGCFSAEGTATIEPRGDPGSARIAFAVTGGRVPVTTIDRYAAAEAISRVDLILIDAEGADFEILKGAPAVLARFRPVVMAEVNHLEAFGGTEEAMRAFMTRLGYSARPLQSEFSRDLVFVPLERAD
jgi:FkbM family methyltransferase